MPFVLVIVGILVALGLGRYYLSGPKPDTTATTTPITRVEDTAPAIETPTSTPVETNAVVTTETTTTAPVTPTTKPETTLTTPSTPPVSKPVTTSVAPATTFKNGTYNVTTTYVAPSRTTHEVNVSLTLANDIVTASNVTYSGETADASTNYQKKFSDAYKAQVLGKSLESISLSRVGGASLTTGAFNKALVEVAAAARI